VAAYRWGAAYVSGILEKEGRIYLPLFLCRDHSLTSKSFKSEFLAMFLNAVNPHEIRASRLWQIAADCFII
jgi:hypothetical protein